jgi:hypothetical protein
VAQKAAAIPEDAANAEAQGSEPGLTQAKIVGTKKMREMSKDMVFSAIGVKC